jgi:radical SAM protein with 4Fe4S-binding SPASM domain
MPDCLPPAPGGFVPQAPLHMVWISTNACNTRCLHCSSNSERRTPDELTTEEVFRLVDDLVDFGVLDLAISGGEPLLRRDLFSIAAHAGARGMAVGVGSNGGKLKARQAAALRDAGVGRVQFSLDGFQGAHDTLRRWPGLFERVLASVALAQESGLRVHLCCTINRLNEDELEPFTAFVAGLGVGRLNFSRYVPTGRGTDALDLRRGEWRRVMERCAALRAEYRGRLDIVGHLAQQVLVDAEIAAQPAFAGCQAGIGQGCVTANGTVFPCVLLPVPVGNVRERPFAEIWRNAPVLEELRDRGRLQGKCAGCGVRDRCGGCRAVAYAQTGDYLAADPRCWT